MTNTYAHDVQYKVKVESIFKGKNLVNGQGTVLIHSPTDICNIDRLETGVRYLIGGEFKSFFQFSAKKTIESCK